MYIAEWKEIIWGRTGLETKELCKYHHLCLLRLESCDKLTLNKYIMVHSTLHCEMDQIHILHAWWLQSSFEKVIYFTVFWKLIHVL